MRKVKQLNDSISISENGIVPGVKDIVEIVPTGTT
jgi:hypothetical protein